MIFERKLTELEVVVRFQE